MINPAPKLLLFIKDFTGRGADCFYWVENEQITLTSPEKVVRFDGAILCHDFWLMRDVLFDIVGDLPKEIIDLDEFRICVSGNPDDRKSREKYDITKEFFKYGADPQLSTAYRKIFNGGATFDPNIVLAISRVIYTMYSALCETAKNNGELERFTSVEIPVYRLLQKAMSAGITIDATGLSEKRKEADYDYFFHLKNYSCKHDMPLEMPTEADIEDKLIAAGFDLSGVSLEYLLEFLPQDNDFGHDTIKLREFHAAKRALASLALSNGRTRPMIDVFGSRTSRVHLRSPSLQNIPKKYRSIIRARSGFRLSYVDFDQYEVGIMAALSEDPELLGLYGAGDMYELFASKHLGLNGRRKEAKQLFLSYAYGMSQKALVDAAVSMGANRERSKAAFKGFAVYEEWKKSVWARFRHDDVVATSLGNHYRRNIAGPLTNTERRSAISQIVQGTASLIFKKSLLMISELDDVTITLPMHDAVLFEHELPNTPAAVVKAFKSVMTTELGGRVDGKASVGRFSQDGTPTCP